MAKVKVFVDYSNLRNGWRRQQEKPGSGLASKAFDWDRLPEALIHHVQPMLSLTGPVQIDFRGVNVYASIDHEQRRIEKEDTEDWLRDRLDQKTSYTVKIYTREPVRVVCRSGHETTRRPERGVDTKIACDMLSLAMSGHYDVGVLITDDSDLIPAVEVVQDVLDRQIVHFGFRSVGDPLRSACWGHLLVDNLSSSLVS